MVFMKRLTALLLVFVLFAAACNGHNSQAQDQHCPGPWNLKPGYSTTVYTNHGEWSNRLETRFYLGESSYLISSAAIGALELRMAIHDPATDSNRSISRHWNDFNKKTWYYLTTTNYNDEVIESEYRFQYKGLTAPLSDPYQWTPWIQYHDADGSNVGCAGVPA